MSSILNRVSADVVAGRSDALRRGLLTPTEVAASHLFCSGSIAYEAKPFDTKPPADKKFPFARSELDACMARIFGLLHVLILAAHQRPQNSKKKTEKQYYFTSGKIINAMNHQ